VPKDLAALLVEDGAVPADVVERALARQHEAGGALDTALLELGAIPEDLLAGYLARAAELPPAPASAWAAADPRARRVFPSRVAERHGLAPFALEGRELALVATYPVDLGLLDEISFMLSLHLTAHVGPEWRVRELIHRIYGSAFAPRLAALAGSGAAPASPPAAPEEAALRPPPPTTAAAVASGFGSDSDEPVEPLAAALAQALESVEIDLDEEEPAAAEVPAAAAPEEEPVPEEHPALLDRSAPPRWSLEDARRAVEGARHRDEVVLTAIRYARDFFEFAAMFAVTRDAVAGHDALGVEEARDRARSVAIWASDPGIFKTVIETGSPYLGPVAPGAAGTDAVLHGLARTPRTVLVYPIVLRERAVCVLFADNGEAPVSARRLGDLLLFLSTVGAAFERIIRDRKKRRRRTSAAPPAPPAPVAVPAAAAPVAEAAPPVPAPAVPAPSAPPPPAAPPERALEAALPDLPETPAAAPSAPPADDGELSFAALDAESAPAPASPEPPAAPPAASAPGRTAILWPAVTGDRERSLAEREQAEKSRAALAAAAPPPEAADSLAALEDRFFSGADEPPAPASEPPASPPSPAPTAAAPPAAPEPPAPAPPAAKAAPRAPEARAAPPVATPPDPASLAGLADRALDADPEASGAACAALGNRRRDPAVRQAAERLRRALLSGLSARATRAARAIGALRDAEAIPLLIQVLESDPETAQAAAEALAAITLQRLGPDARKWLAWWKENRGRGRAEWLFSGLTSPDRDTRVAASVELSHAAPPPVAYTADMPAAERERAARAWAGWWARSGHVL
jgi:hypothetical protein